jgi:hypothetical protein
MSMPSVGNFTRYVWRYTECIKENASCTDTDCNTGDMNYRFSSLFLNLGFG